MMKCANDNESESGQAKPKRKNKTKGVKSSPKKKKAGKRKNNASDSVPSDVEKPVAKAKAKGKAKAKAKSETEPEAKAKASVKPAKKPFVHIGETMAAKRKRIQGELDDLKAMGVCETDKGEEARTCYQGQKSFLDALDSDSDSQSVSQSLSQSVSQAVSQSARTCGHCDHHSLIWITLTVTYHCHLSLVTVSHSQSACCSESFHCSGPSPGPVA